jgi:tetratricopeptide (TPR) repeat protein
MIRRNFQCFLFLLFLALPLSAARAQDPESSRHVTRASVAESEDDYATALEEYSAALSSDTTSTWLLTKVVHCLFRLGRDDEMMSFTNALWRRDSTSADAALDAAEMSFGHGRMDEASWWFRAASRARPESPMPWTRLGIVYSHLERPEDAEKSLRQALKLDPEQPDALYTMGWLLARSKREAEAETNLKQLASVAPNYPRGQLLLGEVAENLRHLEDARKAYAQASAGARFPAEKDEAQRGLARVAFLDRRPNDAIAPLGELLGSGAGQGDARVRALRVDAEVRSGQWEQALADLDTLARAEPDSPDWPGMSARILSSLKKSKEAIAVLKRYEEQHPLFWRSHQLLSALAFEEGRYKDALAYSAQAESLAPDSFQVRFLKGQIFLGMDRPADAEKAYLEAVGLDSTAEAAWFALGVSREKQSQLETSEAAFRRVIRLNPQAASAWNYIGYMYAERGLKLDEALKEVLQALEIDPLNPAYLDSKGWTLFRLGRLGEARAAVDSAIAHGGRDAVIHEHLGDILVALKLLPEARQAYRDALAEDPRLTEVQDKLKKIEKSLP